MKSGTNWLGSLLSSHQEVDCIGEYHWQKVVSELNPLLHSQPIYSDPEYREFTRAKFDTLIKEVLVEKAHPDARVIGERTPHSIEPVTLRGAPHICIVRDGRDVLVSRAFHLYNNPQAHRLFKRIPAMAKTFEMFKQDSFYFQKNPDQLLCHELMVRESAAWWRDHVIGDKTVGQRHPKLKTCFVRYEDLHADTEGQRARLFEFLGVDPSRCSAIEGVLSPGFKKERPNEFLRKGAVGDWKNYFTADTTKWFKEEAGDELINQGYDEPW
jgi:hypothetical protein